MDYEGYRDYRTGCRAMSGNEGCMGNKITKMCVDIAYKGIF